MAECPMLCIEILKKNHLENVPCYAEPLAERMYHNGLVLAKLGDVRKSLAVLSNAQSLTRNNQKKIEIIGARVIVFITQAKTPRIYSRLFRLHRRIVKPDVHVYRHV